MKRRAGATHRHPTDARNLTSRRAVEVDGERGDYEEDEHVGWRQSRLVRGGRWLCGRLLSVLLRLLLSGLHHGNDQRHPECGEQVHRAGMRIVICRASADDVAIINEARSEYKVLVPVV